MSSRKRGVQYALVRELLGLPPLEDDEEEKEPESADEERVAVCPFCKERELREEKVERRPTLSALMTGFDRLWRRPRLKRRKRAARIKGLKAEYRRLKKLLAARQSKREQTAQGKQAENRSATARSGEGFT